MKNAFGQITVLVTIVGGTALLLGATSRVADEDGVPAPRFKSIEATSRNEVIEYGRSLTFSDEYHSIETRRLRVVRNGKVIEGPSATIMPEIRSAEALPAGDPKGRIVAKITVERAFPEMGLGAGDNYVWFEPTGTGLRAVFVPSDEHLPLVISTVKTMHPEMAAQANRRPDARFRWNNLAGDAVWVSCPEGCCETNGDGTILGPSRPRPPRPPKPASR